jgi:hypothetical protein
MAIAEKHLEEKKREAEEDLKGIQSRVDPVSML